LDFRIQHGVVLATIELVDRVDDLFLVTAGDARRRTEVEHRITLRLKFDALEAARKKSAVPLAGGDRLHSSALAGGRWRDEPWSSSVSEPSPYSNHEPMLGRPAMIEPVFMNVWAGS
jgi:hypothetical protein